MLVGLLLLAAPAAEQPARRATTGLHPQDSESREVKELNGLWRFRPDPAGGGLAAEARWQEGLPEPVLQMPVPSSYNDITQDRSLRDLLGLVWYERDFFVPLHWLTRRVVLYVGSANYHATVWARVSPLLDEGGEGWRWLREATRPLDEGEGALAAAAGGAEAVAA